MFLYFKTKLRYRTTLSQKSLNASKSACRITTQGKRGSDASVNVKGCQWVAVAVVEVPANSGNANSGNASASVEGRCRRGNVGSNVPEDVIGTMVVAAVEVVVAAVDVVVVDAVTTTLKIPLTRNNEYSSAAGHNAWGT